MQNCSSAETGTCYFCRTENVLCAPPSALLDQFALIHTAYSEDLDGSEIVKLLRDDWNLLTHKNLQGAALDKLLESIFDDPSITRKKYKPKHTAPAYTLDQWEIFKDEIIRRNRWFANSQPNIDNIRNIFPSLSVESADIPSRWYRARKSEDGNYITDPNEMSAPPSEKAGNGRANPLGIPYLYLGSTRDTAISEIRPQKGDNVTVAEFTLNKGNRGHLKILDLRDPRKSISPFSVEEEQHVVFLREHIDILIHFGEALSVPVSSSSRSLDYLPTQYLCELIKMCNFDGVLYKSSLAEGFNLALFNPEHAETTQEDISQYVITNAAIESEQRL